MKINFINFKKPTYLKKVRCLYCTTGVLISDTKYIFTNHYFCNSGCLTFYKLENNNYKFISPTITIYKNLYYITIDHDFDSLESRILVFNNINIYFKNNKKLNYDSFVALSVDDRKKYDNELI